MSKPRSDRAAILAEAERLRATEGLAWAAVARRLGMTDCTLRRWRLAAAQKAPQGAEALPVTVDASEPRPAREKASQGPSTRRRSPARTRPPAASSIVVTLPSGVRVEGLPADDATTLVLALADAVPPAGRDVGFTSPDPAARTQKSSP